MTDSNANVSLKSPSALQKKRKTQGLLILLSIVVAIAVIGAITKGGKKRIIPVTWKPGEEVDTKDLELSSVRAEIQGLRDAMEKMSGDYEAKIKEIQQENESRFEKKIKSLEEQSKQDKEPQKENPKSNILGDGIPGDTDFETYSLPSLDASSVVTDVPIDRSGAVPSPPKVKRISAKELSQSTASTASSGRTSEVQREDDFSIIDPSIDDQEDNLFTNDEVIGVKKRYVKNPMAGFIPATSSVPIVLITGLDAIASGASQGNPEPVLFRVQDDAFLAGNARYRLSNCNGQAVGYGDLSTTRVKLQATRVVCVDLLENRLLETEINGFISDSDGTLGMRGELQNREGQLAGKALAASFVEGASGLLTAAGTTVSNANGVTQTDTVLNSFNRGFAGGMGNAANLLAERYIEQMEAISPSITVEKGRRAVLHLAIGTKLVWKEYQGAYVQEITPDTSSN